MTDDLAFLPATELVKHYHDKSLSPVEVIDTVLARLEKFEGAVNAFVLYDPDTARKMARESEARWARRAPQGLIDGVPVAIKDTQLTRGWPRRVGSRTIDANQPWPDDAPSTARLRENGAVFFGKTTTPEFGWKPVTDSPLTGITRNPWDLARTPGGSSGGSAVAVLSGVCPVAVGTDAGGSIRIPASFSGVFGHKPSFGRVAMYPPSAFGDVSHGGPITRSVDDAALMLDAMKGPDARDWFSLPADGIAYRDRVREGSQANFLRGKRIALSPTLGYHEPMPAVRAAVERAAKVFADQGAIVELADAFSELPFPIMLTLSRAGMWALLRNIPAEKHALMDPGLVTLAKQGQHVTQEEYVDTVGKRIALGVALNGFFERYDLLLSPTMPITAAWAEPHGDGSPDALNGWEWLTYTWAFNLTKNPSASIPCGFDGGLPIGLMVTGPMYDDLGVLQACRAYEETVGGTWPSAALSARLDAIARMPDAAVKAKILPAVGG